MTYEILYIIPSRFSDTEIDGVAKKIEEGLVKAGATVEKTENLGKIKLAFPIKKERHGTYILTYINVDGEKMKKIDQDLRLTDEILRHTIVKREEGIPTGAFKLSSYEAPITPEGKRSHKKGKMDAPAQARPAAAAEPITMAELDKKLDSILDDKDLGNV